MVYKKSPLGDLGVIVICLSLCVLLSSCKEDEGCRTPRYVRMYTGFYQMNENTTTGDLVEGKLYIDTLSVQGVGVDDYLYNRVGRKDTLSLPLNKLADVSEFVFTFEDTLRNLIVQDTLSVYYQRLESYLSFECGCLHTFTIDSVRTKATAHFIDSIVINSKEVNTADVENIKIYHTP